MTTDRRWLALLAVLFVALPFPQRRATSALAPPRPRPLAIPASRSGCGYNTPLRVEVKALATPVVGQELALKFSVMNRGLTGPFQCRIRFPENALVPLEDRLSWERDLPQGQVVSWTTRVRVETADPIALTAKARSLAPAHAALPAAEGYLTLYPFEVREGTLHATWDEATLQPLSQPTQPVITLPNGDRAIVLEATGTVESVR